MKLSEVFATPIHIVMGVVSIVALGAGGYAAWHWYATKDAIAAVTLQPAIVEGRAAITSRKKTVATRKASLDSGIVDFDEAMRRARADTGTPASTNACFDKGVNVITKCKALQFSYDSLAAAQDTQITRLTDLAVSLRRGKLFAVKGSLGYEPFWGAPAVGAGVNVNFAEHWSLEGTVAEAAKIGRDSTQWRRTGFLWLNYHFGGRH